MTMSLVKSSIVEYDSHSFLGFMYRISTLYVRIQPAVGGQAGRNSHPVVDNRPRISRPIGSSCRRKQARLPKEHHQIYL